MIIHPNDSQILTLLSVTVRCIDLITTFPSNEMNDSRNLLKWFEDAQIRFGLKNEKITRDKINNELQTIRT